MMNCRMKRFPMFRNWLNHTDWPPDRVSPIRASAAASLFSFLFISLVDGRVVSLLGLWWAEFLALSAVPLLLAFVILYRSSWHREFGAALRTFLAALLSGAIFGGVLLAITIGAFLLMLVYYCYVDHFTRFHY
jgi:hypothetical protein